MQEILAKIEHRAGDGIVVADFDRLFRPKKFSTFRILDSFSDAGALIFTSAKTIDLSKEDDSFVAILEASLAGRELRTMRKRMHGAQELMRRNGEYPLGDNSLPLGIGYDRPNKRWFTKPEIVKIQEAYRLVDEDGISNVAEVGRRVGIKYRLMYKLISNPIYKGWMIYHSKSAGYQVTSAKGKRYLRKVPRKADEIIEVQVFKNAPPIAPERWERVQEFLRSAPRQGNCRKGRKPQGSYIRDILVGLSYCGNCKSRLRLRENANRPEHTRGHYACSQKGYNQDLQQERTCGCGARNQSKFKVHTNVMAFARDTLCDPSLLKGIIEHAIKARFDNRGMTDPKGALEKLAAQRERVQDGWQEGLFTKDQAKRRLDKLKEEELALLRVKDSMDTKATAQAIEQLTKVVVKGAKALARVDDPKWQKAILNKVFEKIFLENTQVSGFSPRPNLIHEAGIENDIPQARESSILRQEKAPARASLRLAMRLCAAMLLEHETLSPSPLSCRGAPGCLRCRSRHGGCPTAPSLQR